MPKHTVTISAPTLALGKADTVFDVTEDGAKLGELRISMGAAVWYPSGASYAKRLSWKKLAEAFENHGVERAETKKRQRKNQ